MSTQNTLQQPAAQSQYKAHQANIRSLIQRLEAQLAEHATRASARPADWGYAGDLGYIETKLQELVSHTR